MMEKSIQVNSKLSKLQQLQRLVKRKEEATVLQQQTRKCLDTVNQALLYPVRTCTCMYIVTVTVTDLK